MTTDIIRSKEMLQKVKISRASVYRFIAKGEFPAPVKLGTRAVAWRTTEIDNWIASRAKAVR